MSTEYFYKTDSSLIEIRRDWLNVDIADSLLQLTTTLEWEHRKVLAQGQGWVMQPRQIYLTSADSVEGYIYSGQFTPSHPWVPEIEDVCSSINLLYNSEFNSCLMNEYLDGTQHVSYHSDSEGQLGTGSVIVDGVEYNGKMVATISLGATRRFAIRKRGETKQLKRADLCHGDLLLMAGECQSEVEHSILKQSNSTIELYDDSTRRVSLTFRSIH
jgi:alkylated DNA repair dioxygenase AlkB